MFAAGRVGLFEVRSAQWMAPVLQPNNPCSGRQMAQLSLLNSPRDVVTNSIPICQDKLRDPPRRRIVNGGSIRLVPGPWQQTSKAMANGRAEKIVQPAERAVYHHRQSL